MLWIGWPLTWKIWKTWKSQAVSPWPVREFESGQGKWVLVCGQLLHTCIVLDTKYGRKEFFTSKVLLTENSCHSYERIYEYCSENWETFHFVSLLLHGSILVTITNSILIYFFQFRWRIQRRCRYVIKVRSWIMTTLDVYWKSAENRWVVTEQV